MENQLISKVGRERRFLSCLLTEKKSLLFCFQSLRGPKKVRPKFASTRVRVSAFTRWCVLALRDVSEGLGRSGRSLKMAAEQPSGLMHSIKWRVTSKSKLYMHMIDMRKLFYA